MHNAQLQTFFSHTQFDFRWARSQLSMAGKAGNAGTAGKAGKSLKPGAPEKKGKEKKYGAGEWSTGKGDTKGGGDLKGTLAQLKGEWPLQQPRGYAPLVDDRSKGKRDATGRRGPEPAGRGFYDVHFDDRMAPPFDDDEMHARRRRVQPSEMGMDSERNFFEVARYDSERAKKGSAMESTKGSKMARDTPSRAPEQRKGKLQSNPALSQQAPFFDESDRYRQMYYY